MTTILKKCLAYLRSFANKKKMLKFYSQFINEGDLCFDVGANIGDRTGIFLKLGARVVAIEPQTICQKIEKRYGSNKNLIVINKGLADKPGYLDLSICDSCSGISTMSNKWKKEGRFSNNYNWVETKSVPVVTLDSLIAEYGAPKFCKIDVEGFEYNVLNGLSKPMSYMSFEFTKEFLDDAKKCVDRLSSLGDVEFNYSLGESMELSSKNWMSSAEIISRVEGIDDNDLWGDIYAKFLV